MMHALAASPYAETTTQWVSIFAADMEETAGQALWRRVQDREDDLSALGLAVLYDRLCLDAFGVDSTAAARMAASYLTGWFVLQSWGFRHGMRVDDLLPHEVLAAVYGWAVDGCGDQDSLDNMNRRFFRKSDPWST